MTILTTKNKPTHHLLNESWLDTVLTTSDTGSPGTPNVLIDSDSSGKLSDEWMYSSAEKLTISNTPYATASNEKFIPSKYFIKIDTTKNNGGYIDSSFLYLLHPETTSQIVNLNSSGKIDFDLLPNVVTTSTGNSLVQTNQYGRIDYSFISTTDTSSASTIVKTKEDGFLNRNFFNIQRVVRVIKITNGISSSTDYTISSTTQNESPLGTLTIPSSHLDLFVFLNGSLLTENHDYTLEGDKFRFVNGLHKGDILQFIALN